MSPKVALCTTAEFAAFYRVDASTVRRWVAKGLLVPAMTTLGGQYRFDPATVGGLAEAEHNTPSAA